MAGEVVPLETRLALITAGELPGVSVTALCAELGLSRQTFYRLRARYRTEGPSGLAPRSRRPHRSPNAIDPAVELEIIRLRTEWPTPRGAASIGDELRRGALGHGAPSPSTIHRVLVRNGLVGPRPDKRPRSSWKRFVYPEPNGCWQIDATAWHLTDRAPAWIMDVLDDHSRLLVAALVCTGPTTAAAQAAILSGAQRWGLPARVLCDNGTCFGGPDRTGDFPSSLALLGIALSHSRPYHPQTCGKIERLHQTLKQWLATQPRAADLAGLQTQLDAFTEFYNHHRPHRALAGATPAEAWTARDRAGPAEQPGPLPDQPRVSISRRRVSRGGVLELPGPISVGIGTHLAGTELTALRYGQQLLILDRTHPLRALTLTPARRYYRQTSPPLLATNRPPTNPPTEQGASDHTGRPTGLPAPAGPRGRRGSQVKGSATAPSRSDATGALDLRGAAPTPSEAPCATTHPLSPMS
ncbi:MAG TPA: IS481 family transposase [Pseudonocardiaceae bacterium]|nr:IS481 family transposase [Pseudonocardiaceae bacterium]